MKHVRRPSHSTIAAYTALLVAMSGTAVAATGGNFLLGRGNYANTVTTLTNTGSGPALSLRSGSAPLAVNNSQRVTSLNSDFLDGLTSTQFQRRVSDSCAHNAAITSILDGGGVTCSSPIMWAAVRASGTLAAGTPGVRVQGPWGPGTWYNVTFPRNVTRCAYIATSAHLGTSPPTPGLVTAFGSEYSVNAIGVATRDLTGANAERPFHLLVVC